MFLLLPGSWITTLTEGNFILALKIISIFIGREQWARGLVAVQLPEPLALRASDYVEGDEKENEIIPENFYSTSTTENNERTVSPKKR